MTKIYKNGKKYILSPFNVNLVRPNTFAITKEGLEFRVICTNFDHVYFPIIALAQHLYGEEIYTFSPKGVCSNGDDKLNLFHFACEK